MNWTKKLLKKWKAKWPKRHVRPLCRFVMTNDMQENPKCINQWLRQQGYTSGDKIVVMLESDFTRIAELAHKKVDSPIHALLLGSVHAAGLSRSNLATAPKFSAT